jgi:hypothetical protein
MQYEEALRLWGKKMIEDKGSWFLDMGDKVDPDTVVVTMTFNEGYTCCNGTDPSCYCSFAESPRADVDIKAMSVNGRCLGTSISVEEFDFVSVLKEIIMIGNGSVTL